MPYEVKATTKEVLAFIKQKRFIEAWQLCEKYGYTNGGAKYKLWSLKKKGLIINMPRGQWTLTITGNARLNYYAERDKRG